MRPSHSFLRDHTLIDSCLNTPRIIVMFISDYIIAGIRKYMNKIQEQEPTHINIVYLAPALENYASNVSLKRTTKGG